jgi:ankyrin repeat protein
MPTHFKPAAPAIPLAEIPPRTLPDRPDLRHLKDQARELVTTGQAESVTKSQFLLARLYGFASWRKLKAHVDSVTEIGRLKAAIDADDVATVVSMMTRNPSLHKAPLGYGKDGPLTWAAECRIPGGPPSEARLEMVRWMIENGSDVHQGSDGPLMRAALRDDRIPMMELLLAHGADINAYWRGCYPIVLAPCETLQPESLRFLLENGADPKARSEQYGDPLQMLAGSYLRGPADKHACMEALAEHVELDDTPIMAFHRGRIDLLAEHLAHDPVMPARRFSALEVSTDPSGTVFTPTPVQGVTLLHLAIEYDEIDIAKWLIASGANPNARSSVDTNGFGGHTPLFHAVVTLGAKDNAKATLLLDSGADPALRASVIVHLRGMDDPDLEQKREFVDSTAAEYARGYPVKDWIAHDAVAAIESLTAPS